MKRNGKIEFLRFLMSLCVLCFHAQKYLSKEIKPSFPIQLAFFPHGVMAVEFFFVVTGFLMASTVFNAKPADRLLTTGKSTLLFMKKKFMGVFPMHCIAFVLVFITDAICNSYSLTACIDNLLNSIPGLFFVQMAGFEFSYVNDFEWYLSVMLICMFIIYPLLRKWYEVFSRVVAPIASILILGYMIATFGKLSGVMNWEGLCYRSMLRGFAEICLGIFCYEVCRYISKENTITKRKKLLITAVEAISWIGAFCIIMLTVSYKYELYALGFIAVGITCSFTGITYGSDLFNKKFIFYLGKLSLPIYLSQKILIELVPAALGSLSVTLQMTIAILGTIIISIGLLHLTKLITKKRT